VTQERVNLDFGVWLKPDPRLPYDCRVDRDEQRRASLQMWEAAASGWEHRRAAIEEINAPVMEWMLGELAPRPGDTVLDLAAGPGGTGFAAAALVGESGRVISTDFSPAMVEVARRRAAELGLENVEHRAMDAENIDLADDSVDGVLCRFGYMLMPDSAAALSETRRVLRPGGRLALAVWSTPERNPWLSVVGRMFVELGHVPPPDPDAPSIFAMANEEYTVGLLRDAGFDNARTEEVPVRFRYRDVDEYVAFARDTGGMFATVWRETSEEEHQAILAELEERFAPFATDGGYEMPGVALAAVAS
jgi:ubiquinone/menaquinone biosynthesis C-methylase UbiE